MASTVSICNRALQLLGDDPIQALTDDTHRARALNVAYEVVRDAEMRRRRWRFAIRRDSLPALADQPDSDYDYQYQVPNDFLRLIEGGDIISVPDMSDYRSMSCELWSLEGRRILTNLGAPLKIRYLAKITDVSQYDPAFNESFAARLAFECCERITQSDTKKQTCWQAYRDSIKEAVRANALEVAPHSIGDDTWVIARAQ